MRKTLLVTLMALSTTVSANQYEVKPSVILESLASDYKTSRQLSGGLMLGLGGLIALGNMGSSNDDDYYEEDTSGSGLLVGGIFAGFGAAALLIESKPEKSWNTVKNISDQRQRESTAYTSIVDLADIAKTGRQIDGVLNLAMR